MSIGCFPRPLDPLVIVNVHWKFWPYYRPKEKSPQATDDQTPCGHENANDVKCFMSIGSSGSDRYSSVHWKSHVSNASNRHSNVHWKCDMSNGSNGLVEMSSH